jgi:hypothetical protein
MTKESKEFSTETRRRITEMEEVYTPAMIEHFLTYGDNLEDQSVASNASSLVTGYRTNVRCLYHVHVKSSLSLLLTDMNMVSGICE